MYLLDTCVISDFVKGEPNTLSKIKSCLPGELFMSSITVMEIEFGLLKNPQKALKIEPVLKEFIEAITILDFGEEEAKKAGFIRLSLTQSGIPIGPYDFLIGATALAKDLTLITSNIGEF